MNNIPPEARELVSQFQAGEAARRAAKEQQKAAKAEVREHAGKTVREFRKKVLSTGEAERLARDSGLEIETGGGKHGKHIVAENGKRISLPDHGDDLSTGVSKTIQEFVKTNGVKKP